MIKLFKTTIASVVIVMVSCTTDNEKLEAETVKKEVTVDETKKSNLLQGSEFITTWNGTEITIPISRGLTYNYDVDWNNDGIVDETGLTGNVTHTFDTPGRHTIRISGDFPAIKCSGAGRANTKKIVSVNQWGTIKWKSMRSAFARTTIEYLATDVPDLSHVTDMSSMFSRSKAVNLDVSKWDVSNVTNMRNIFNRVTAVNPEVSNWNVSKVTNMAGMFNRSTSAKPDVSKWDVSSVTDMSLMFGGSTSNNLAIGNWNVSNVTRMSGMFYGATSTNLDISNWNVSSVTDMSSMFSDTSSANPDVSKWDVSSVTDMTNMFYRASSANPDVSNWNIVNVTEMDSMLRFANSFSTTNYEGLLINFSSQPHTNSVLFETSAVAVSAAALAARQSLINDGWTIYDGNSL